MLPSIRKTLQDAFETVNCFAQKQGNIHYGLSIPRQYCDKKETLRMLKHKVICSPVSCNFWVQIFL
jgi:hypothetical protein